MSKFKDYITAWDEAKLTRDRLSRTYGKTKVESKLKDEMDLHDLDLNSLESVYKAEMRAAKERFDVGASLRLVAEYRWYLEKRPYFNVYPIIERKLKELSPNISMSQLTIPFEVMEIRTYSETYFAADFIESFYVVVNLANGRYVEAQISKNQTLGDNQGVTKYQSHNGSSRWRNTDDDEAQPKIREALYLICGLCMLVNDRSVVQPVVLSSVRRDFMTQAELDRHKDKAIRRTGKIGFEVGRDLQSAKASAHYRNGCFAKYWVSKEHEQYPANCLDRLTPVIKWRSGAIVNASVAPKVPTGFKDAGLDQVN